MQAAAATNSNIIFGAVLDESMQDEVRVTVIATGFDNERPRDSGRSLRRRGPRDREVRMDDGQRSSLQIRDDEIDIPAFLRDS